MTATFCNALKSTDPEGYGICKELVTQYPTLQKSDFDTGVSTTDFSRKPYKTTPAEPDGTVSSQEVRQLALEKATTEYKEWITEIKRDGTSTRKSSALLASKLRQHGMFIPWFFYSEDSIKSVLSKLRSATWKPHPAGDLEIQARMMYRMIQSASGLGIRYSTDPELRELGVDDLLKRKIARCEELIFLEKGIALIMGLSQPNVHDTMYSDSDIDHVYTSFKLPKGLSLFLDPLLKPITAQTHPKHSATIVDDLHLLGIYEMNATSRNCITTKCGLERSKRALSYSPIYRNHFLLGNSYAMDRNPLQATHHYKTVCRLKPDYYPCNR
ncbi:MAG: hypothetical protein HN337_03750 [Deltaproteobacteria bacterium]|nr:hypothetical protein [Deltaproteobacteria bacterium]